MVRDGRASMGCAPAGRSKLHDVQFLLGLFQCRAVAAIVRAGQALAAATAAGKADVAWNATAPLLYKASFLHIRHFIFDKFVASIAHCEDASCREVLSRLAVAFALADLTGGEGWTGLLTYNEAVWAEELLDEICAHLRPDIVPLTDAFDFPDRILNSTLGRSDGIVYEALLAEARKSGLNVTPTGERDEVPEFVHTLGRSGQISASLAQWHAPCSCPGSKALSMSGLLAFVFRHGCCDGSFILSRI